MNRYLRLGSSVACFASRPRLTVRRRRHDDSTINPAFNTIRSHVKVQDEDDLNVKVTLIPGDGNGSELSDSVVQIFDAAKAPVSWDRIDISALRVFETHLKLSNEIAESILRNKVALKAPFLNPSKREHRLLESLLKRKLKLFANVRACRSVPGVPTAFDDVDLVVIRENTEGEHCGIEHQVVDGVVQSLKLVTRDASLRVAHFACNYASANQRKKVTIVHKANIMRMSDGLFLKCAREVAQSYPNLDVQEMHLDTVCLKIVEDPSQFEVLLLPHLYGDVLSAVGSGIVGGVSLTPSINIGNEGSNAVYEMPQPDSAAPGFDSAGFDRSNPIALILGSVLMLRHLNLFDYARRIERACLDTIKSEKNLPVDLGGKAKCSEFTREICERVKDIF